MKKHLLAVLAASALVGCAVAPQPTAGFTQSIMSLVQRVSAGVRPAPAQAAPVYTEFGDEHFRAEYAMALAGDRDAMVELARMYGRGSNGVARDERAMIGWLRHASQMQHANASYLLYLYYLERGMDRDALRYEALALRQGFVLPARLDPRRG